MVHAVIVRVEEPGRRPFVMLAHHPGASTLIILVLDREIHERRRLLISSFAPISLGQDALRVQVNLLLILLCDVDLRQGRMLVQEHSVAPRLHR